MPIDELLIDNVARWAKEYPTRSAYTFIDYTDDPLGRTHALAWPQVHRRARAIAASIRESVEPGECAAILIPQGLDYITALLGALYARVIAVPLFSPDLPGHADRLVGAYTDAEPALVLTTSAAEQSVTEFLGSGQVRKPEHIICVDSVSISMATAWTTDEIDPDQVAYLQYTSGSTRAPAGVEITHRNLTANAGQLWEAFGGIPLRSTAVLWLPLFHDMGLVATVMLPLVYGNQSVFMDPVAFIMRPDRWLRVLGRYSHVFTGGPNFAYEYCATRVTEKADLDLSDVRVFLNGAEPIRPATLDRFYEAFAECGLRREALCPAYGLAEATVYVSAASPDEPVRVTSFDRDALAAGEAKEGQGTDLISCGRSTGQRVAVVADGAELPDGKVGELWVRGPNVAKGYWRQPARTEETFGSALAGQGGWLRTGDLGVISDGDLYVTGRIKDLVIVDGSNHYPQDIEVTVHAAHPAIRRDHVAAFAVPTEVGEALVLVAERSRYVEPADCDLPAITDAVRTAVTAHHRVGLHDFVLVEPGGVARTSSGKIARTATRQAYLAGGLPGVTTT
jgi:fatty acid CoA ligase FadD32